MVKYGRLQDLFKMGVAEVDPTKLIVENASSFLFAAGEDVAVGYGLTPNQVVEALEAAAEQRKKAPADYAVSLLQQLSSELGDTAMTEALMAKWSSKKAMKKKKLIAVIREMAAPNESATVQMLKACSKDFTNLAVQYMGSQFRHICVLKHLKVHPVLLRVQKGPEAAACTRARVIHVFDSSCKAFQLRWQVVVDFDWSLAEVMTNIAMYITGVAHKTKETLEGEKAEALAEVMVCFKAPRAASVRKGRRPSSVRPAVQPEAGGTTDEGTDSTCQSDDDDTDTATFDDEEEGEEEEEEDDDDEAVAGDALGSSALRGSRLSRFLSVADGADYRSALLTAVEEARAEAKQVPLVDEKPKGEAKEDKAGALPVPQIKVSPPAVANTFEATIQAMMCSPTFAVSEARPAEGEAMPTPQQDEAASEAPKEETHYSLPLLMPGEIAVQDNVIDNVKHKYGERVVGRKDGTESKEKRKWFGASRLKNRDKKQKKSQARSVHGRIIVTNCQLIFVPVVDAATAAAAAAAASAAASSAAAKSLTSPKKNGPSRQSIFTSPAKSLGSRKAKSASMFLRGSHRTAGSDTAALLAPEPKRPDSGPSAPLDDLALEAKSAQEEAAVEKKPEKAEKRPVDKKEKAKFIPGVYTVEEHVYVPFLDIYKVEVLSHHKVGGSKVVEISCKDFRTLYFSFSNATMNVNDFISRLKVYFPTKEMEMFAFRFADHCKRNGMLAGRNGWQVFNAEKELQRIIGKDPGWRITKTNDDYQLCDTYMRILAVPASVTDEHLHKVKEFRSRGRLPALSWRHPETRASLTRCSQPKVGMTGARCVEDEQLLWQIMVANQKSAVEAADSSPQKKATLLPLYLMDARPRANAMANHAVGAGFEDTSKYKNTKLRFLNIPNIHVMRDALRRLHEICLPQGGGGANFLSTLESTHWLEYIHLLIVSAVRIVKLMSAGINVLIHCSDGWDRTSQLSALVMLLSDPYYRTLEGFMVLVEKEWLGYGHKICVDVFSLPRCSKWPVVPDAACQFRDRCGHLYPWAESETSPIFLQFIDAVWQITEQFPGEFEFNSRFLILLLDQINSGQFGTFLCNNTREREEANLSETTISLWTHVFQNRRFYTHASFVGLQFPNWTQSLATSCTVSILRPCTELKSVKLWTEYYFRFDRSVPSNGLLRESDIWAWHQVEQQERIQRQFVDYKDRVDLLLEANSPRHQPAKQPAASDEEPVELRYEKLVSIRLRADLAEAKAQIADLRAQLKAATSSS